MSCCHSKPKHNRCRQDWWWDWCCLCPCRVWDPCRCCWVTIWVPC